MRILPAQNRRGVGPLSFAKLEQCLGGYHADFEVRVIEGASESRHDLGAFCRLRCDHAYYARLRYCCPLPGTGS